MNTRTNIYIYIYIYLEYRDDVILFLNKYNDNVPIYLDIDIHAEHHGYSTTKMIYLRYSNKSEKTILYEHTGPASTIIPLGKGWYVQKRRYISGSAVPNLLKLLTFLAKIKVLVYNIYM